MSFVPRRRACLKNDEATGWFAVVFVPARIATSALMMLPYVVATAPWPTPSNSAATLEAWHRRVQWSMLFVPKPARMSFWKRYASSLEHFAEPKPAIEAGPLAAWVSFRRAARVVDLFEAAGGEVERLLPGGLAEVGEDLVVVDEAAGLLLLVGLAAHV